MTAATLRARLARIDWRVIVVAVALVAAGGSGGYALAQAGFPAYRAIAYVELPAPSGWPQLPRELVSPRVVLRVDGALVRLGAEGYELEQVPPTEAAALFARLSRVSGSWADAYPLSGPRSEHRVELRLIGATPRTILIDNPLQNPTLPDPLYRLVVALLRPSGVASSPAQPISPPAVRLQVLDAGAGDGTSAAEPMPAGLDLAAIRSTAGMTVAGEALRALERSWPSLRALDYPHSSRLVSTADERIRLAWVADWSGWIEAVAP